ncbi:MAG: hypothetical protein HY361_02310 [Candidatus Aenigmarchaeota archaeon]|nr:hypothetical protein [Candidatus Aenigmarchaeota archaeon]
MTDLLSDASRTGIFDALIPFLIIYTILYTVFQRARITEDKRINVVLSLSISFLVVFSPAGLPIIQLFRQLFSGTAVLLIFLVIFITIAFLLGIARSPHPGKEPEPIWLLIVSGIFAFYLLVRTDVLKFLGLSVEAFPIPDFIFVLLGVIAVIAIIIKYAK